MDRWILSKTAFEKKRKKKRMWMRTGKKTRKRKKGTHAIVLLKLGRGLETGERKAVFFKDGLDRLVDLWPGSVFPRFLQVPTRQEHLNKQTPGRKSKYQESEQRYILTIKRDCFRISSKHLQEAWLSNRIEIKMYFVIAFNVLVKVE